MVTSRKMVPAIRAIPIIQMKTSTHTFSILLRLVIILIPAIVWIMIEIVNPTSNAV